MKLQKLFLSAFGPFTDKLLDFSATPARVHLVFGPNEAGKSSALRAMADLRFGIPLRSGDNFVHDNAKLLLAGVFQNADGQAIAVARRKKNKDALTAADPATGLPLATPVSAAVAQALTAGMDRAAFERSFGLDHTRLREGGRQLLQGEGELGAALFEASAGLQGVKALLASLQDDAKNYYSPRATQAIIPEALRQIDEQKAAFKLALTRPAEWKDRQRARETANAQLADLKLRLVAQNKRIRALTELRAVLPLLQQNAQVDTALEAQNTINLLAVDAREQRLAAQHTLATASTQRDAAQAEIDSCTQLASALQPEPALLAHAPAIERLVRDCELLRQQRGERLQTQVQAEQGAAALLTMAQRIQPQQDLASLLLAVPGAAERVALDALLDDLARLAQTLAQQQARLAQIDTQLADAADGGEPVAAPVLDAVDTAVQQATALADAPKRQAEQQRSLDALAQRVEQGLADLRLPSTEALQAARPLLLADIAQAEKSQAMLAAQIEALQVEDAALQRTLQTQQLRQQQLAAVGEIVSAQSLQQARERRDADWQLVKEAYADPQAAPAWPTRFEQAQTEADRQADLLREGAQRAAEAADCALRISEANQRRSAIADQLAGSAALGAQQQRDWQQILAQASLPPHTPAALREWQGQRQSLVELCEQRSHLQREWADSQCNLQSAITALAQALQAAGQDATGDLSALLPRASAWLRTTRDAAASRRERARQQGVLQTERAELLRSLVAQQQALAVHAEAQTAWTARLFLPQVSGAAAIRARLNELAALDDAQLQQTRRGQAIAGFQAREDALYQQAHTVAALLAEPAVLQTDDFADGLGQRLVRSQAHAQQAIELQRRLDVARGQHVAASREVAASQAVLQQLCAAAGVAVVAELPEAEDRSHAKRGLQDQLNALAEQLRQVATRPLAELRAEVAGLDVADIDTERSSCEAQATQLEADIALAAEVAQSARRALEQIDTSAAAAEAREQMESAVARLRAAVKPWAQLKLAETLLQEALRRFRERAQAPMVRLASEYFGLITGGRYPLLLVDASADKPVLQAQSVDGRVVGVEAMSEGTADQLYLALRLAALELQRGSGQAMPLVLDDVLMTSDDSRAAQVFQALARFAEGGQVLLFTHHQHLLQVAQAALPAEALAVHHL
ncbi:AAA family ATPase [Rhodoferax sp.]|uniref:ATP-binding protein n=1 Tax=Rhodoferax sp. TaxID=50421 RepID=UPI00374D98F3